jgi:hypothetical protein
MKKIITIAATVAATLSLASTASASNPYAPDRSCGQASNGLGVIANKVTSCGFAKATANAVIRGGMTGTFRVYSNATGRTYAMRARMAHWPGPDANPYLLITGGNGVKIKVVS